MSAPPTNMESWRWDQRLQRPNSARSCDRSRDIAAEHHVKLAQRAKIPEQVPFAELRHPRDRFADPPAAVFLAEVPHQHLHRQAALHLKLGVQPITCPPYLVTRQIGADYLDP